MNIQSKAKAKIAYNLPLIIMAAPGLILLIMFSYVPMFGLVLAFKDYIPREGVWGSTWVGLENFKKIFSDGEVWNVMKNTVLYHFAYEGAILIGAIILGILLYNVKSKKLTRVYQIGIQTPYLVSTVAIGAIVYLLFRADSGLVNSMREFFGKEPIAWYNEGKYWPAILIGANTWFGVGIRSIYFYSALLGIDTAMFEAADIDGARWYHKVFKIMIPSIAPTISMLAIMSLGKLLVSDFAFTYAVTRNSSALYHTTDVIATYAYRGLRSADYSLTTALELVTGLATTFGVLITNWVVKKTNPDNAMF